MLVRDFRVRAYRFRDVPETRMPRVRGFCPRRVHGDDVRLRQSDPLADRRRDLVFAFYRVMKRVHRAPVTTLRTGAQAKAHLASVVDRFNKRTGAALTIDEVNSYFLGEPLGFNPNAKIVKRLMASYSAATGIANPTRHLRRWHLRQTPPQRHRLRHMVPRQTLPRPRRRRKDPHRGFAEGSARADLRTHGHRDRPAHRRRLRAVTRSAFVAADDSQQAFEFVTAETERADVRADDVFAQVSIHLDDDRPGESGSGHHEVIAFRSRLDTACELADVAQFLPGNLLHAVALRSVAASYAGIVR
jgi:hypothetical protein